MPADPEHHHADPRQQQGHDERRRNGSQEELLQEITHETTQKTDSPVSLPDIGAIEEEQVLLLATHQVIRVGEQEKGPRSKESQGGGDEAGTELCLFFMHYANMRIISQFSKTEGAASAGRPFTLTICILNQPLLSYSSQYPGV